MEDGLLPGFWGEPCKGPVTAGFSWVNLVWIHSPWKSFTQGQIEIASNFKKMF